MLFEREETWRVTQRHLGGALGDADTKARIEGSVAGRTEDHDGHHEGGLGATEDEDGGREKAARGGEERGRAHPKAIDHRGRHKPDFFIIYIFGGK